MSKAIDIVKGAMMTIGAHSEVQPAHPSLFEAGLGYLISLLEDLRTDNIILTMIDEEDGEEKQIPLPDSLDDELYEPEAATQYLKMHLAIDMVPVCRIPLNSDMTGQRRNAYRKLAQKYRINNVPMATPSKLLHRGQGNRDR